MNAHGYQEAVVLFLRCWEGVYVVFHVLNVGFKLLGAFETGSHAVAAGCVLRYGIPEKCFHNGTILPVQKQRALQGCGR